jgi:hypothetical protein
MAIGKSSRTKVISFRVPNEVYDKIVSRVEGQKPYPNTVPNYCREIVMLQVTRSHTKGKGIRALKAKKFNEELAAKAKEIMKTGGEKHGAE